MKLARQFILATIALGAGLIAPAASAQPPGQLTRCRLELASASVPESGKYLFVTQGKVSDPAYALFDYTASTSARAAVYPTDARDLLNPYSSPSLSIGYFGAVGTVAPHAVKPAVGYVSFGSMGKDFKPIPGSPVRIKLIVDGAAFGPYETKPSSLSTGQYSVWLDTADSDGDGKPPILDPADFARLAKVVGAMKSAEIVLVQDGVDIVRTSIPFPQFATWRDGLAAWASKTKPGVGAATSCPGGGEISN